MMEWRTARPESDVTAPASHPITGKTDIQLPGPFLVRILLWCLVFVAFPVSVTAASLSFKIEVLGCIPYAALPAERSMTLAERVLLRLEKAEQRESDVWLRDDIRIAWITVLEASRGNSQPHIDATYRVLGLHPDKVWQAILDRRAALLGRLEEACATPADLSAALGTECQAADVITAQTLPAGMTTKTGTRKNSATTPTKKNQFLPETFPKKPCASERNPRWRKSA